MTKGEFVSSIMNDVRLNTKDTLISRRQVLSVGESYAKTYIAQRLDELKLEEDYGLISVVKCFELESVDYISCNFLELKECRNIMKSVNKLPETIKGSKGYAVFMVASLDDSVEYKEITRYDYRLRKKRKYIRNKSNYFFIEDDYLIFPDETIETVNVYMIVLNEEEAEEVSSCSDCKDTKNSSKCKSLWDEDFKCPDKLIANVRSATLQEISMIAQIPEDSNPNLDSNQKGKTVN